VLANELAFGLESGNKEVPVIAGEMAEWFNAHAWKA
jgi:hypothetical protein